MAKTKHQEVNGIKFKVSHQGEVLENAKYGIRLWTVDPDRNDDEWRSEYIDETIGVVGYSAPTRESALDKLLHNAERDFSNMKEEAIRHLSKLQKAYDKLPGNKEGS